MWPDLVDSVVYFVRDGRQLPEPFWNKAVHWWWTIDAVSKPKIPADRRRAFRDFSS
jgi:hypothetical protein